MYKKCPYYLLLLLVIGYTACNNHDSASQTPSLPASHTITPVNNSSNLPNNNSTNTSIFDEVEPILRTTEWISIAERKHVKYRPQNCPHPEDLSFRYKLSVLVDTLYLLVEVQDDTIFMNNTNNIVSDHVELWLADPHIQADHETRIKELNTFIEEQQQFMKEHGHENEEIIMTSKAGISTTREIIKGYQKDKYYTQWVFNPHTYTTYPHKQLPQNAEYTYHNTTNGYKFALKLPLQQTINSQSTYLTQLYYLVDISDIDAPNLSRQECLMSSSETREYGVPSTFNLLTLSDTIHLHLSYELLLQHQINSDGRFLLQAGKYQYYINESYDFMGVHYDNIAFLPGSFTPMHLTTLEKTDELTLAYHEEFLVYGPHQSQKIHPLTQWMDGMGGIDIQLLYFEPQHILLRVTGATKWPEGPGRCGGGFETNLLYLQFDENYQLHKQQSELISSCDQNITLEYDTGISQIRRIEKGEEIALVLHRNGKKIKSISFNSDELSKGIQVK